MEFPDKESLRRRFENYTNDQLLDILKHPKDYQEAAIEAATELALERGLINSRYDLAGPEFRPAEASGTKLFPVLNTPEQNRKLRSSLIRILALVTIFPVMYAILSFAGGNTQNVLLSGAFSLVWGSAVYLTSRTKNPVLTYVLFFLFYAGVVLALYSDSRSFLQSNTTDLIIRLLAFLLINYVILYLRALLLRLNN